MNEVLWKLQGVALRGRLRPRLDDVSLEIAHGTTAIVGYSGAGKTSLLNLLTGFETPDAGRVEFTADNSARRLPVYWAPQTGGLWPHLTVSEHLQTVAAAAGEPAIEDLLRDFDLTETAEERPDSLSQGEQSRLAVIRALASGAAVLVMDEPLVNVDPARFPKYWKAIRHHCDATATSLVVATHDPATVLREAGAVVCLHEGRVAYCGGVEELYYTPATSELAAFLGPANWMTSEARRRWLDDIAPGDRCLRPEQIEIAASPNSRFVVRQSTFAGSLAEVELVDEQSEEVRTFVHRPAGNSLRAGERVSIKVLASLLICLLLAAGCTPDDSPTLEVKQVNYWSMPSEGTKIPAPRGMTVGPANNLYVLDNAARVLVFDESGKVQRQWMMPESDLGNPEGICVFRDGRVAVADTHYGRVVLFDQAGNVLETIGQPGKEPGEFIFPVAIIQDPDGNFYVGEYGNNDRVQKFSVDGEFLLEFGGFGTGAGQFQRPSGLLWREGKVYVTDAFNNRVQVFSDGGKFLEILGESEPSRGLHYPYDIAGDAEGNLYVVEYGAGRVSKLDKAGKLLGRFGTTGTDDAQFSTPWGLAVGPSQRVLVADTGNRRIVELRL